MSEIHALDAAVYNKIAAGEVIEKPASVVKELVENALDAGSTEIVVRFDGGGLDCVTVSDNGKGIAKEDIPLVFMPHATSKIHTADDLNRIDTLGFRGEAMASIAAVAMVRLTTKQADSMAYTVEINGGKMGEITPSSGAVGTEVTVRNLFYHTPARLKFLKSAKQEGRDIIALCEKIIIANPTVKFKVYNGDALVRSTLGEGLAEAVRVVYGEENFDHMLPIEVKEYGYRIYGYTSDTDLSAGTRASQITVLNGRVVNNATLSASINNAYRDYLMKRNYPMFALHIVMPADEVDVNVHPTKSDVRFTYANKLFGLAYRVVHKALEGYLRSRDILFDAMLQADAQPTESEQNRANNATERSEAPTSVREDKAVEIKEQTQSVFGETTDFAAQYAASYNTPEADLLFNRGSKRSDTDVRDMSPITEYIETASETQQLDVPRGKAAESEVTGPNNPFDETALRVVGQVLGTYIVAEYKGDMILIDQHAAAERVLYNRLVLELEQHELMIQPMLVPYRFTLGEEESQIISSRIEAINAIGIELHRDNDTEFSLYSVPSLLTDMNVDQFIHLLLSEGFEASSTAILHEKLAYTACRSAIKGNTYLDNEALRLLIKDLFNGELPGQCPHGRPAYVRMTRYQLDKMFKRIV